MPRVICELPNASEEISGVKFFPLEDGRMISDEIDDAAVERFCSIDGYVLDEDGEETLAPPPPPEPEPPRLTKAQQKKLEKEAAEKLKADQAVAGNVVKAITDAVAAQQQAEDDTTDVEDSDDKGEEKPNAEAIF